MFYQYNHFGTTEYFCKEYGEDFNFPMHLHNSFEFITVKEGKMTVVIDGMEYILKKGESVLIFPNQLHSLESETCSHMLCIFSSELVRAYYYKINKKIPLNNKVRADGFVIDYIDKLLPESSVAEKKGILYLLCAIFDKETDYTDRMKVYDGLLYKIFDFVERNYSGDCTLEKLSKETGYNYSYLSRSFKKSTGISFNSYVNQYRISNACYLLSNTGYSIVECALESGYESLRSFNRNFIASRGVTPSEYRMKK